MRKASLLVNRSLVDTVKLKHEDGSEWVLFSDLTMKMVKGPRRKRAIEPEAATLF